MRFLAGVLPVCLILALTGCQPTVPREAFLLSPQSLADRQMQTRRFETSDRMAMLAAATSVLQDLGFTLEQSEASLGLLVGSKTRDATSGAQIAGALLVAALGGGSVPIDSMQQIRVSMVVRSVQSSGKASETSAEKTLAPQDIEAIRTKVSNVIAGELREYYAKDVRQRIAEQLADKMVQDLQNGMVKRLALEAGGNEAIVRVTFQRTIVDTAGRVTHASQINDAGIYQHFYDKLAQAVFLEAHEL